MRLSLRARVLAGIALVVVALAVSAIIVTTTTRAHLIDQVDDRLATAGAPDRIHDGPPREPPTGYERRSDVYEGRLGDNGEHDHALPVEPVGRRGVATARCRRRPGGRGRGVGGALHGNGDQRRRPALPRPGRRPRRRIVLDHGDPADGRRRHDDPADHAGGRRHRHHPAAPRRGRLVGGAPRHPPDQADDAHGRADRQWRPLPPCPRGARRRPRPGSSVSPSTRCSTTSTRRSPSEPTSQERLRRFVADASHELRTPVTTIRGYAELYRVGGLSERSELDEAMRRTEQEAVRMSPPRRRPAEPRQARRGPAARAAAGRPQPARRRRRP